MLGTAIAALVGVSAIDLMAMHVGVKSVTGLALLLAAPCLWVSLALQAKRFRDIGWNPLDVIPGWLAVSVVDLLVAVSVPTPGAGRAAYEQPDRLTGQPGARRLSAVLAGEGG